MIGFSFICSGLHSSFLQLVKAREQSIRISSNLIPLLIIATGKTIAAVAAVISNKPMAIKKRVIITNAFITVSQLDSPAPPHPRYFHTEAAYM